MAGRSFEESIGWMEQGTAWLMSYTDQLSDEAFRAPSLLPGWSRAHIVAHLARNAEALERLLRWARTGVESPMYSSPDQRSSEIDTGSQLDAAELRRSLRDASVALALAARDLPTSAWSTEVRSATGRILPASEVPWLRTREVWLHTVDLDAGGGLEELPEGVIHALIDDIVASFASRSGVASVRVVVRDDGRDPGAKPVSWTFGDATAVEIEGTGAAVLGWLSGRESGEELRVTGVTPVLPAWL